MTEQIELSKIRTDGGTQSRVGINLEKVHEYAEAMEEGAEFDDIVLFYDGTNYWLTDGFHRHAAAKKIKRETINAEVHQGTQRDAVLESAGANSKHGLPRTNSDKRRAVMTLLNDAEWSQWSDREIAKRTGTSNRFVSNLRHEISGVNGSHLRTGSDGKTYTVKHWAEQGQNGKAFWEKCAMYNLHNLSPEQILESIQPKPRAKVLTDLNLTNQEAHLALRRLAIAVHREEFPKGSYVKHTTGRIGRVHDALPEALDVLDSRLNMITAWMVSDCTLITEDEWKAATSQTEQKELKTVYLPGEPVITGYCAIADVDKNGVFGRSGRTMKEGEIAHFVSAFEQGEHKWAEVNWKGNPTILPLGGITKMPKTQFAVGDTVTVDWDTSNPGTINEIKEGRASVTRKNPNADVNMTHWISLDRLQKYEQPKAVITIGDTVKTDTGHTGIVRDKVGDAFKVETKNGIVSRKAENLTKIEAAPDEIPSAEDLSDTDREVEKQLLKAMLVQVAELRQQLEQALNISKNRAYYQGARGEVARLEIGLENVQSRMEEDERVQAMVS